MSSTKKSKIIVNETICKELELADAEDSIIVLDESTEIINEQINLDADDSFMLDTGKCDEFGNEAYKVEENANLSINSIVSNHFRSEANEEKRSKSRRSNTQQCFNCHGDHPLNKCTEKHDKAKIAQNRSNFMTKKRESFGNTSGNTSRFHEESIRFKPGMLSAELRNALGLGEREIPPWIFRMRKKGLVEGYPPAYKKTAVEDNVLKFITESSADIIEEGVEVTLDVDKMIQYPGFNYEDRRLSDPEKGIWKIPPWDKYLDAFKALINDRNRNQMVPRVRATPTQMPTEQKKVIGEEQEVIELDLTDETIELEDGEIVETLNESSILISMEEGIEIETKEKPEEDKSTIASVNGTPTPSTSKAPIVCTPGTPIPLIRHISRDSLNHEFMKPELDQWAAGIQPFRHQEEIKSEKTGFFKRMHTIMRKVITKKKPAASDSSSSRK